MVLECKDALEEISIDHWLQVLGLPDKADVLVSALFQSRFSSHC